MDDILAIKQFWFGMDEDDQVVATKQAALWWGKNEAMDAEIKNRFGDLVQAASRNELDTWQNTPDGLLALILLTDQFTRNIYRNHATSFAQDALARVFCQKAIQTGADLSLRLIERVFMYLPLEHSESLDDQFKSVALFTKLYEAAPEAQKVTFEGFLNFAKAHHKIIARFGRFPHRNEILNRKSTPEELLFLQEPNSSF